MKHKRTIWLIALAGVGIAALFLLVRPSLDDSSGSNADSSRERMAEQDRVSPPLLDQPGATPTTNIAQPPSPAGRSNVASSTATIKQPEPSAQWTDEDGRSTNAIRRLAHNEAEVARMLFENDKIYRRQLVALKEPVVEVVQQSRLTGEPLQQLTLQGLDGQEIQVKVQDADIDPSGLRGWLNGHVAGRPGSLVSLAFLKERQAYTIISPEDNLFLDVEAHEPGDVVVKSIYLEKYGVGKCGTPEHQ